MLAETGSVASAKPISRNTERDEGNASGRLGVFGPSREYMTTTLAPRQVDGLEPLDEAFPTQLGALAGQPFSHNP